MVVMKQLIHNLRFGYVDIKSLTRDEILGVLDYCLPADVIQLCQQEITRRRNLNLEKQK